jgi:hypothetical protein
VLRFFEYDREAIFGETVTDDPDGDR